jgi:MYXO-CTERM domain-containing protein
MLSAPLLAFFSLTASADTTYNVTLASAAPNDCTSTTGTFETTSAGGVLLEVPGGSSAGCYVGGFNSGGPTGMATTFISGLGTGGGAEGTAAGLNALTTGWYAEFGTICDPTSASCVNSNSSTNAGNNGDGNSADIEVLVNSSGSSQNFTTYDTSGNADNGANTPAPGCSFSGSTFTVAAHTVCFEDLGTGGSIALTINSPAVPEPKGIALIGLGVLGLAGFIRRRRQLQA